MKFNVTPYSYFSLCLQLIYVTREQGTRNFSRTQILLLNEAIKKRLRKKFRVRGEVCVTDDKQGNEIDVRQAQAAKAEGLIKLIGADRREVPATNGTAGALVTLRLSLVVYEPRPVMSKCIRCSP